MTGGRHTLQTLRLPRCLLLALWAPPCAATRRNSRQRAASGRFLTPRETDSLQQLGATRSDPLSSLGFSPCVSGVRGARVLGARSRLEVGGSGRPPSQSFHQLTAATYDPLTTCRISAQTGAPSASLQQVAATRTCALRPSDSCQDDHDRPTLRHLRMPSRRSAYAS